MGNSEASPPPPPPPTQPAHINLFGSAQVGPPPGMQVPKPTQNSLPRAAPPCPCHAPLAASLTLPPMLRAKPQAKDSPETQREGRFGQTWRTSGRPACTALFFRSQIWGDCACCDHGLSYPFRPNRTRASTREGRWRAHGSLTVCVFLQGAFSDFCCVRDAQEKARSR